MTELAPGLIVGDRFEVELLAGQGGMSRVYRARDTKTKRRVALKFLSQALSDPHATDRFHREASLLAELQNPGIVAYVAHGEAWDGQPFLAMEWLDGEDLSKRLRRGPLALHECVALLRRVASALVAPHRRGVVHRDIKPSNLFLRDNQVAQATLLDFGIARRTLRSEMMTRTGSVIGTPEYMAPEQARGQPDIGPSADIFSLGCVLYECLTGRPPFTGEHIAAVLAKILFDEATPVRARRQSVPDDLDALLGRMLAKDSFRRPKDAAALLESLEGLAPITEMELTATQEGAAPSLVDGEQQLVSVLLVVPQQEPGTPAAAAAPDASERLEAHYRTLRSVLLQYGAHAELLADDSLLVTLLHAGSAATDQAIRAAHCALVIHERWPDARIAVATGRGLLRAELPLGQALDRAGKLLRALHSSAESGSAPTECMLLDDVTAGLLGDRFVVAPGPDDAFVLQGERSSVDETRLLLGKPTPCIGRERELSVLDGLFVECRDESEARAVLVTGGPGLGKSRLRHELLRRLGGRKEPMSVLFGRGDPIGAGASYGLLSQAIRRLWDVSDRDDADVRRAKLRRGIEELVSDATAAPRIIEFLGELCGVPFPDEQSPRLRAARQDPRGMSEQVNAAFVDFLRAKCRSRPLLLILEDLHWGDALTVRLVDVALRELSDQPFMVLALARPEVHRMFPGLWAERHLQQAVLGALGKKASERLIQQVMGPDVSPAVLARIVEQSGGNALYLEELIRAVASGKGGELPETVLAMLQARILQLDAGARRVLRAASVFGDTFWRGGVAALVGHDHEGGETAARLTTLVDVEIVERHRDSRWGSDPEYGFRHPLMRDAAYSLLTDADRERCHRLAGDYLAAAGESDPMILAEHFERGGEKARAISYFLRAAEQALVSHDWEAVHRRAERGIACGAEGAALGEFLVMRAWAYNFSSDITKAYPLANEGLGFLPPGGLYWCKAISVLMVAAPLLGELARFGELVKLFAQVTPEPVARVFYIEAGARLVVMFSVMGDRRSAAAFVARIQEVAEPVLDSDESARGLVSWARCGNALFLLPDPWSAREHGEESVAAFTRAEAQRNLVMAEYFLGISQVAAGDRAGGVQTLRDSLAHAERVRELWSISSIEANLAVLLVDPDGAGGVENADEIDRLTGDVLASDGAGAGISAQARCALGKSLFARGDLAGAEAEIRAAHALVAMMPTLRSGYFAPLVYVLLRQGRVEEARAVAAEGLRVIEALGGAGYTEVSVWLAAAEADLAAGDKEGARRYAQEALARVERRAGGIPEPSLRRRFLQEVRENVRVQELAGRRLDV